MQRQKKPGLYEIAKPANLRDENTHAVVAQLPPGTQVTVTAKGPRQSRFRAGLVANEHSWSRVADQTGWIEDSKLRLLPTIRGDRFHLDDQTTVPLEFEEWGDLGFVRVVGDTADTNILIHEDRRNDPWIHRLVKSCLMGTMTIYRGIPIWHSRHAAAAEEGKVVPFGAGPPDFVTRNSAWVPFSEDWTVAAKAAMSSFGQSNPGMRGGLDTMPDFDPTNPEQEVGRVVQVTVGRGTHQQVCFFKPGEVQLRGPADCETYQVYYVKDIPADALLPSETPPETPAIAAPEEAKKE